MLRCKDSADLLGAPAGACTCLALVLASWSCDAASPRDELRPPTSTEREPGSTALLFKPLSQQLLEHWSTESDSPRESRSASPLCEVCEPGGALGGPVRHRAAVLYVCDIRCKTPASRTCTRRGGCVARLRARIAFLTRGAGSAVVGDHLSESHHS